MELKFRNLKPSEIDVRIATLNEKGATLLLYKDARVDMDILDETVGATNWQRHHIRENANCIVSIWDNDKKQWISKEDTGTESNTEKEKGLASDSFKRACFNWGIGRELYTSPFIWIPSDKMQIIDTGKTDAKGKKVYTSYDKFKVEAIEITDNEITGLAIINQKGERVFTYRKVAK